MKDMKIIEKAERFDLSTATSGTTYYITDMNVSVCKFGYFGNSASIEVTDLTNATKAGKTCKIYTVCGNYMSVFDLANAAFGSTAIRDIVELFKLYNDSCANWNNADYEFSVREVKGVNVFSPFAAVKPIKTPAKWTIAHVWKAILAGQIIEACRDYRYTDDYAYDAATDFGAMTYDNDGCLNLAAEIMEDGYSGWYVSCDGKPDNNGNYIVNVGLHSFEGWTLVFCPSAREGIAPDLRKIFGTDRPAEYCRTCYDYSNNTDPDPDNDPEPTKPDGDYAEFDGTFDRSAIISVTFGSLPGVQDSAVEAPAPAAAPVAAPAPTETDSTNIRSFSRGHENDTDIAYSAVDNADTPPEAVTADGSESSETAEPVQSTAPAINEELARRALESYSFSDYKEGSATANYNAKVAEVRSLAESVKNKVPAEFHGDIDRLVSRYAAKLAEWTNKNNRIQASCPSWAICGPANYPMKKHEKQMNALDNSFKELDKIEYIKDKIRCYADRPIMAGDESAIDRLTEKVEKLRKEHEEMKQANADARKEGKTAPYGTYFVSLALRNLKTAESRLEELKKAKETPTAAADDLKNDFCEVVRNTDIMRLQLLFDGKPDDETRDILKSNGFRWAPSQQAWQRQLTQNAERAARRVVAKLNEMSVKA